jgi:NADH dehydrogenase/NADH:ubiquinone oxidoreductase subunit G
VETDGTFTNFERRTAPFAKAVAGPAAVLDTWTLCQRLSVLLGTPLGYDALSDVHNEILSAVSGYAGDGLVEVSCQPKYTDVSAIPSAPITSGGPPPLPGAPRQPEMLCRYSEVGTWMKKRNSTS